MQWWCPAQLTHWGRVTHICVRNLTIIGSDNGLSPGRRQAIIWTNAGILLIGPLGTNFSEILIEIHIFSIWCNHYYLIPLFINVLDLGFVCQVTSRHILFWMVYCGIKDMRIVWFWDWSMFLSLWGIVRRIILTHWGRVTRICVSRLTIVSSDNGLSPGRVNTNHLSTFLHANEEAFHAKHDEQQNALYVTW